MKPLDIRDISIIDAFPAYRCEKIVLTVGCGEGRIDHHLILMGYDVHSTDIIEPKWAWKGHLNFQESDIFDLSSFPWPSVPIVICSEVLEHLEDWILALKNLLSLTEIRLIITVPYRSSFGGRSAGHVNYWHENNINEFEIFCSPYSVSITKIRTKLEDVQMKQWCYLIVVDKRQSK